jgi:hypothetical protein
VGAWAGDRRRKGEAKASGRGSVVGRARQRFFDTLGIDRFDPIVLEREADAREKRQRDEATVPF